MSREEVEELKNEIDRGIGPVDIGLQVLADEALEKLVNIALSSIPARYTPREEVTEGWWSCRNILNAKSRRECVLVGKDLKAEIAGIEGTVSLSCLTDFLPVPAWLLEGIK